MGWFLGRGILRVEFDYVLTMFPVRVENLTNDTQSVPNHVNASEGTSARSMSGSAMPQPYKPIAFANEFIRRSYQNGVSHMKLQKLVYCSYGWWLAYNEKPVISEQPQVWRHGPVFKSLYFILQPHGWKPIRTFQNDNFTSPAPVIDDDDTEIGNMLDWVWGRYEDYSAEELSDLTHRTGSPWEQTVRECSGIIPRDTTIPDDRIKEHFRGLVQEYGLGNSAN